MPPSAGAKRGRPEAHHPMASTIAPLGRGGVWLHLLAPSPHWFSGTDTHSR